MTLPVNTSSALTNAGQGLPNTKSITLPSDPSTGLQKGGQAIPGTISKLWPKWIRQQEINTE
jgi:hypothetical protein